jgi:hypothetical protein
MKRRARPPLDRVNVRSGRVAFLIFDLDLVGLMLAAREALGYDGPGTARCDRRLNDPTFSNDRLSCKLPRVSVFHGGQRERRADRLGGRVRGRSVGR